MARVVQIAVKPKCPGNDALDDTGRIWCASCDAGESRAWTELTLPPNCTQIRLDEVIAR